MTRYEQGFMKKCASRGMTRDESSDLLSSLRDNRYVRNGAIAGGVVSAVPAAAGGMYHYVFHSTLNDLFRHKPAVPTGLKSLGFAGAVLGAGTVGGALIGKLVQRLVENRKNK